MMRFDTQADWFESFKEENLRFTGVAQARLDDQFDSPATLCIGLDRLPMMEEDDLLNAQVQEELPNEIEVEEAAYYRRNGGEQVDGRSNVTGY